MSEVEAVSTYLEPLLALARNRPGSEEYFRALIEEGDEYVAVGALGALLDRLPDPRHFPELGDALRYGSIRTRVLSRAAGIEPRYLISIIEGPSISTDEVRRQRMLAEQRFDNEALEAANGQLYLATGLVGCLIEASQYAEAHSGWRAALRWVVRAVLTSPLDQRGYMRLYSMLSQADQTDLLLSVADVLGSSNLHPQIASIFRAGVALTRGRPDECLALLAPLPRTQQEKLIAPLLGLIFQLRALAEETLKDYREAYEQYRLLNEAERNPVINAKDLYLAAKTRDTLFVPPLPKVERTGTVQMVGFPRSGTTLLENVLSAHPNIETFEEIPALQAAYAQVERAVSDLPPGAPLPDAPYLRARAKYFEEIDLRRRKDRATVLIDKMPLRSVEVAFLNKLFPEWRYVFSIRHPFDVVLSCFKQRFQPNIAMENFRSIEEAARLYDYSMSQWFGQFSMDNPRVCYVRYEELVLKFEPTIRRVLDFVGVGWDAAVTDFAAASEGRAARTPSYQKVRQGLGIGVQTSWRNYDFVFKTAAADPLRKWVEFFGYEATP